MGGRTPARRACTGTPPDAEKPPAGSSDVNDSTRLCRAHALDGRRPSAYHPGMRLRSPGTAFVAIGVAATCSAGALAFTLHAATTPASGGTPSTLPALVDEYCLECHDNDKQRAGLSLEGRAIKDVARHPEVWEKVLRKLRARQMPPASKPRPSDRAYDALVAELEATLDRAALAKPNPGRTAAIRRLTRTEYQNAIRDLLDLHVDVATLLPQDESSYGFDNVTVGDLSPTLLDRYVSAASRISRIAVGRPERSPGGETIRTRPDLTQEDHIDGLPIGTRGGALIPYTFPMDGEYEIAIRLTRDRDELVEGLSEPHEIELLIDRERVRLFTVTPPQAAAANGGPSTHAAVDRHLTARLPIAAGPHAIGVTFLKKPSLLLEGARQPYRARFNSYRHPRVQPAVYSVSIVGPHSPAGGGNTPSRRRIFVSTPANAADEDRAARQILTSLMRRAYRRPVAEADLRGPLALYGETRASEGFEAGIEMALSAVLVSPEFLFRVEREPAGLAPGTPYRITDLELASRLSFFLWSSVPDDELLDVAAAGKLKDPAILERQVKRMLADDRAKALVTNFAAQWLHLRSLDAITPDMRLFPDFDDNLRQAFRQETLLFFESILREDRSVLDLIRSDYTFVNERLARHYGIPNVYGSRFRRVALGADRERGGLLRQASILTVTSYATRTSPVVRGKWILDNLLGLPPPPPPADVPALKDNTVDGSLAVRSRLAEHRKNPTCAACHNLMDPVGLSLEKFDAVGRRRSAEAGIPIDASGGLPDGSRFTDVDGLEQALLKRPEVFAGTVTEKLLTYALGRGVEHADAPAVRVVLRRAGAQHYRLSSIILGVVNSQPFQMRTSR
jgi:mono/diheme cytochrome c family protein